MKNLNIARRTRKLDRERAAERLEAAKRDVVYIRQVCQEWIDAGASDEVIVTWMNLVARAEQALARAQQNV